MVPTAIELAIPEKSGAHFTVRNIHACGEGRFTMWIALAFGG